MTRVAAAAGVAFVLLAALAVLGGRQVGALTAEAAQKPPESISWRGGFTCEGAYERGAIVFHEGSSYMAAEPIEDCRHAAEAAVGADRGGRRACAVGRAGPKGAGGPAGRSPAYAAPMASTR